MSEHPEHKEDLGPGDGPGSPLSNETEARIREVAFDRARRTSDYSWRPHVFEGMYRHLPVADGHPMPAAIASTAIRSLAYLAGAFKPVPEAYVAVDLNADGYSAAQISCPCSAVHEVEIGTVIMAACDRAFYWFGQDVFVLRIQDEDSPPG